MLGALLPWYDGYKLSSVRHDYGSFIFSPNVSIDAKGKSQSSFTANVRVVYLFTVCSDWILN
jgi:hypothetical protein